MKILSTRWKLSVLGLVIALTSLPLWAGLTYSSSAQLTTIDAIVGDASLVSSQAKPFNIHVRPVRNSISLTNRKPVYFLVQGGLHGNEILTSQFVNWLSSRVQQGKSQLNQLPPNAVIDFLPYANPDAYAKSRYNPRNVNLNRNFDVLWGLTSEPNGKSPFSEPESKAIRALMQHRRYLAAIDVHGYVNWVVAPSSPSAVNITEPAAHLRYSRWLDALQNGMQSLGSNYEIQTPKQLGDGGAFEDWAYWGNNTFAACLEMIGRTRHAINSDRESIDMFERYESFIFQTFSTALKIEEEKLTENKTGGKTPPI